MGLKIFLAKLVGKKIGRSLNLKEDSKMEGSKKWWTSKTIWGGFYMVLRATYIGVQTYLVPGLPDVPPFIDTLVGGIVGSAVIQGRVTATKTIG